ncbi:MAG TPA: ribonuclease P protein subunit [Thermoplasmataceae archaeon]|nr:ribonuclease P protein subunit [Thermoplasmataceae archaeon]
MKNSNLAYLDEFVGSEIIVKEHSNRNLAGLRGKVVMETMKTFSVLSGDSVKMVPKSRGRFLLKTDEWQIDLDHEDLLIRPEDRMKDVRKLRKLNRKW